MGFLNGVIDTTTQRCQCWVLTQIQLVYEYPYVIGRSEIRVNHVATYIAKRDLNVFVTPLFTENFQ